jgi:predicted permease
MRDAVRTLQNSPGFAVAAILTLALGIGANTAVFSVVDTVLVKPLSYPAADRIVLLMTTWRGRGSFTGVSAPKFTEWRRSTSAFEHAVSYRVGGVMNLTERDQPEQISVAHVSADFFRLFGARVARGRTFTIEEDQPNGPHVVVVSHEFWQRQMRETPDGPGGRLSLDGDLYRVIGVLEPGFDADSLSLSIVRPEVWLPLQLDPNSNSDAPFFAAARMRDGITLSVAQAQTDAAATAIRHAFPAVMPVDAGLTVEPLRSVLVRDVRPSLILLFAAVGCVLLIVCANIANLLLVRASTRRHEMAVRLTAGATRGRIVRQLLSESVLLSALGGALGLVLAVLGTRALLVAQSSGIPPIVAGNAAFVMDWRVLAYTAAASIMVGLSFGLVPALYASRVDLEAALRAAPDRGRTPYRHNLSRAFFAASQVAIAAILLVGSGLLVRSFITLRGVDPGFETRNILTTRTAVTGPRFSTVPGTSQLVADGLERVSGVAGVDVAAATLTGPPLSGAMSFLNITVPGRVLDGPYVGGGYLGGWHLISPRYFEAFRIPLVAGRTFTDRDRRGTAPVVIVNQALARQFWPDGSALNQNILIGLGAGPDYEETTPRQIVGVVGDVHHVGLQWAARPTAYVPLPQTADNQMAFFNRIGVQLTWVVRAHSEPLRLADAIRDELRKSTGGLPIVGVRTMDEVSSSSTARAQFAMSLMSIFGVVAMLLASIGVFGVIAYNVRQRTREIGIRVALGANPDSVRAMVLFQGMRVALSGVAIGAILALALSRLLRALLFGVTPHDGVVFVSVPILLSAVAFVAVWLPARRAALVDPVIALRHD